MDNLLKKSALAYQELMKYRYLFKLGHKNKLTDLSISFPSYAYFHLAGFHKVGFAHLQNKKKAIESILTEAVTEAQFVKAGASLEDRWEGICRLQAMLERADIVFRYRGHENPASRIKGDYLIVDNKSVLFIMNGTPESIFSRKGNQYEQNCPKLTILEIVREDICSGDKTVLYRRSTYVV